MLEGKKKINGFWEESINTTIYFKNISPAKSLDIQTPFEYFNGDKPKVSHLRLFGCKDFAHVSKY